MGFVGRVRLPMGARARSARARSGQVPAWIPLLLLVSVGVWLVSGLEFESHESGFTRIDPRFAFTGKRLLIWGGGVGSARAPETRTDAWSYEPR